MWLTYMSHNTTLARKAWWLSGSVQHSGANGPGFDTYFRGYEYTSFLDTETICPIIIFIVNVVSLVYLRHVRMEPTLPVY